jgi:general transcription factor 3C polypeptide 3 (transcription factor C subunit 4)
MEDNIDVRITLSSLFVDVDKSDEAIVLLSPPNNSGILSLACSMQLAAFVVQFFLMAFVGSKSATDQPKPWWLDGKVKMHLANIYYNKGMFEDFVGTILIPILETLNIEYANRKVETLIHI